jgi:pSer/pThr/pTyr-binding forkhead associated (FHA) protein
MTSAPVPLPENTGEGLTRESAALSPQDERERLEQAAQEAHPAPGRYIALTEGSDVKLVSLREPITRIGRSMSADVVLEHSSVSRRHAMIVRRGEHSVLLDDRSMNGILINGQRKSEATLSHGDEISLGRVVLRFVEV